MIPPSLKKALQESLNSDIKSITGISGGSINRAARLELASGKLCFVKWNETADPDMFVKEQKGLEALTAAGTMLCIPEVYTTGRTTEDTGFLVQEFIDEGRPKKDSARNFGRELARLHQNNAKQFGFVHDNYIGRLPQSNQAHANWTDFFIEERLAPQLQMAVDAGKLGSQTNHHFEQLYEQLPDLLPKEPPALLHGDLWGGNYFYDGSGQATVYDPAVYYGHREIELAFTHLFGGFEANFYHSYENITPLEPGFSDRKDIYNLYPLLVHTNLFGGSYARQVRSIVKRF